MIATIGPGSKQTLALRGLWLLLLSAVFSCVGCATVERVKVYDGPEKAEAEVSRIFIEVPVASVNRDDSDTISFVAVDDHPIRGNPKEVVVLPGSHQVSVRYNAHGSGNGLGILDWMLFHSLLKKVNQKHAKVLSLEAEAGHAYLIRYGVSYSSDTFKNPSTKIVTYTIDDHGKGFVGGPVSLQRAPIRR